MNNITRYLLLIGGLITALLIGRTSAASGPEYTSGTETLIGMGNPAAVYCQELGYDYQIELTDQGERGVCRLPEGESCGDWDFLDGSCGQNHNYCAQQGWGTAQIASRGEPNGQSAVCVDERGRERGEVGALMNLAEKSLGCGVKLETAQPEVTTLEKTESPSVQVPPASFDWRNYQGETWLTPIRNQGQCGSCWAFAAVGVTEANLMISRDDTGFDRDLSEQYFVTDAFSSGDCCGGYTSFTLYEIRDNGVPLESCLPYADGSGCSCYGQTCDSNCTYNNIDECSDRRQTDLCSSGDPDYQWFSIDETGWVPYSGAADRDNIKQHLIDYGPLTASLNMEYPYKFIDGVFNCDIDDTVNHGVIIVGYNDVDQAWIVRNSWGTGWGDEGYFKVGYGECSIEDYVYYVDTTINTFDDVPYSHDYFNWIEALYSAGITAGCSPDPMMYCPDDLVTRAEMAIFLLRGKYGWGHTPPPVTDYRFNDIPGDNNEWAWAADWIEQLANEGITAGCGEGNYCPGAKVNRAQMALFLLRASKTNYQPSDPTGTVFEDVIPDDGVLDWADGAIEDLAAEGITGGCSLDPPLYCPNSSVTRGTMAVFLVRAFGLPME